MKHNRRVEDYMKVIFQLQKKNLVRGVDIAHELGVSKPTVSVALREMEDSGLITVHLSRSVELTEKGKQIARYVMDRYNTVYNLLTSLGVDEKTAEQDACKMEHGISDKLAESAAGTARIFAEYTFCFTRSNQSNGSIIFYRSVSDI